MVPRARLAVSALAVAAIAVIVTQLALGLRGAGTPAAPPCAARTDATVRASNYLVARRLRDEERAGPTVDRARHSIESDRTLAAAVAAGDGAAARQEALVLLFNHEHIVRLRVRRGRQVLADVGGRLVLTPVIATLRAGGRIVGTVEFSVQDDMGYRLLAARLVGLRTVMRFQGATVMADIGVGDRALPRTGTVRVGHVRYLVRHDHHRSLPGGHARDLAAGPALRRPRWRGRAARRSAATCSPGSCDACTARRSAARSR